MTTGRINQGAARGPRAPPEESGGAAGGPRGALGHDGFREERRRSPRAAGTRTP
jgi:hypothetical protein